MNLVNTAYPHPLREDAHGVVRVGSTRVTLESVVTLFEEGASAEEIALRYDALSLSDVYATLSFYTAHRAEVAEYLKSERQASARARSLAEKKSPLAELRRQILERKSA